MARPPFLLFETFCLWFVVAAFATSPARGQDSALVGTYQCRVAGYETQLKSVDIVSVQLAVLVFTDGSFYGASWKNVDTAHQELERIIFTFEDGRRSTGGVETKTHVLYMDAPNGSGAVSCSQKSIPPKKPTPPMQRPPSLESNAVKNPTASPSRRPSASSDVVFSVDDVQEKPERLAGPQPVYPPLLQQVQIEGSVMVEAIIDTLGHVEPNSLKVVQTANPGFNESAKQAILGSTFRPARLNGKAVRVLIHIPIQYSVKR